EGDLIVTTHHDNQGGNGSKEHLSDGLPATLAAETIDPRVAKLEAQLRALEQLAPFIASVQDQADGLAATQRRTEVRLAKAAKDAELVQSQRRSVARRCGWPRPRRTPSWCSRRWSGSAIP
ncbi:MAG: hypothetical protein ACYSWU_25445, partial [Planctomycetota bacterium]